MTQKEHNHYKGTIHFMLVNSYLIFLFIVILGIMFDLAIPLEIFSNNIYQYIGFLILIISSGIIYWAQKTSHDYKNKELKGKSSSHFEQGPYKYLRNPTHFSLFVMTLGFALIINSFFSVVFTVVAYILTKIFFIKKEEMILEKKYGEVYSEYKKKVKNWI